MSPDPDETEAPLADRLRQALDAAENDEARYQLREALQIYVGAASTPANDFPELCPDGGRPE